MLLPSEPVVTEAPDPGPAPDGRTASELADALGRAVERVWIEGTTEAALIELMRASVRARVELVVLEQEARRHGA